jgi:hypothetical protein
MCSNVASQGRVPADGMMECLRMLSLDPSNVVMYARIFLDTDLAKFHVLRVLQDNHRTNEKAYRGYLR